jgi:serine/threonine protein kinase
MPQVIDCLPFYDFVNTNTNIENKKIAYAMVIAQIIRLFIQLKVMHFDLHSYNALVSENDGTVKTKLIDFGSASNFKETSTYLLDAERTAWLKYMNEQENQILTRGNVHNNEKKEVLENILKEISDLDYKVNLGNFGSQIKGPQMGWYEGYKNVPVKTKGTILVTAYEMLVKMMTVDVNKPGITPTTINEYIRNGQFVDFSKGVDEYYVTLPSTSPFRSPPCDDATGRGCSVSGGRRLKSKRTKVRRMKHMTRRRK